MKGDTRSLDSTSHVEGRALLSVSKRLIVDWKTGAVPCRLAEPSSSSSYLPGA